MSNRSIRERDRIHVVDAPPIPERVTSLEAFVQRSRTELHEYTFHRQETNLVLEILRGAKVTGRLTIDFSQGGIGRVCFVEERKISPKAADRIPTATTR